MPVITVSRQYASGGSSVAQLTAERLGWTLIDNEFIDRVAERVGLTADEVAEREERIPGLIERLAGVLSVSSAEVFMAAAQPGPPTDREMVRVTEAVIEEAVQHGDVVLVGRGAPAFLSRRDDTLHVFVVAPRAVRIARAIDRLDVSERDATRKVDDTDEARRNYVQAHYRRTWDDPTNYDVAVNTGRITYEQAAGIIASAAEARHLVTGS
jgi:cytidylate kinase